MVQQVPIHEKSGNSFNDPHKYWNIKYIELFGIALFCEWLSLFSWLSAGTQLSFSIDKFVLMYEDYVKSQVPELIRPKVKEFEQ